MQKKYELLKESTVRGHKVRQIRYLIDIPKRRIKAGDLGGYLQSEANLSHKGNCVVLNRAIVINNATVEHESIVKDDAEVMNDAVVSGQAVISKKAMIDDKSLVTGLAEIKGKVCISGMSIIQDSKITRDVYIGGKSKIIGISVEITGSIEIIDSRINGNVKINGKGQIKNSYLICHLQDGIVLKKHIIMFNSVIKGSNVLVQGKIFLKDVQLLSVQHVKIMDKAILQHVITKDCNHFQLLDSCEIDGISSEKRITFLSGHVTLRDSASITGGAIFFHSVNMEDFSEISARYDYQFHDKINLSGDTGIYKNFIQ